MCAFKLPAAFAGAAITQSLSAPKTSGIGGAGNYSQLQGGLINFFHGSFN
jgi:hypothetical protein